jgi:hypothetical protein
VGKWSIVFMWNNSLFIYIVVNVSRLFLVFFLNWITRFGDGRKVWMQGV